MKNLKELAAVYDCYTAEDIPERYRREDSVIRSERFIPELLLSTSGIEAGEFWCCKTETDHDGAKVYFVSPDSYKFVKREDSEVILMLKTDRNKMYYFYPYYAQLFKYREISEHVKAAALKGLIQPDYIGVFTQKKVNNWVDYYDKYMSYMESLLVEGNRKNQGITKQIEDFIEALPKSKVERYENKTWVTSDPFLITFTHIKDRQYLQTEVVYKGTLNEIVMFQQLVHTATEDVDNFIKKS